MVPRLMRPSLGRKGQHMANITITVGVGETNSYELPFEVLRKFVLAARFQLEKLHRIEGGLPPDERKAMILAQNIVEDFHII